MFNQKAFLPITPKMELGKSETLSTIDDLLDLTETIIWRGRPAKKTIMLQSLAGIPFALIFGSFGIAMHWYFNVPLLGLPLALIVVACCLVLVPPVWFLTRSPNTEYALTNRRLLIKTGPPNAIWSTQRDKIKGLVVKTGLSDRLFGTIKLYPITADYPYDPKLRAYSRSRIGMYSNSGMYGVRKVYNLITGVYDEISEIELYRKSISHPHLEGIEEPQKVIALFNQTLQATGLATEAPLRSRLSTFQKIGLSSGVLLLSTGTLIFAWGFLTGYTPYVSYESGYTFVDQVAIAGYGCIIPGILVLLFTGRSLLLSN